MGFFNALSQTIGNLAKSVVNPAQEAKLLAMSWSFENDHFLALKYKSGSISEKMAAFGILQNKYPDGDLRRNVIMTELRTA